MILAVKIGQNDPDSIECASRQSKHGDIIQCFPDNITTFGREGDKVYHALKIDTSHIDEDKLATLMTSSKLDKDEEIVTKRIYYLDFANVPSLDNPKRQIIETNRAAKCAIKPAIMDYAKTDIAGKKPSRAQVSSYQTSLELNVDISSVNDFKTAYQFDDIASHIINKETGKTLLEEWQKQSKI